MGLASLLMATSMGWAGIPGDLTDDGQVNLNDLIVLASEWLFPEGASADIDGGGVGISDLAIVSSDWLQSDLNLILRTRDRFLPGVAFLVRVELLDHNGNIRRDIWDTTASLAVADNPSISLSAQQVRLINGMGSALVTVTGNGEFTLLAEVLNRSVGKRLMQLDPEAIAVVSGTLAASQTWSGVHRITGGDFTIPAGITLTLEPGTMVLIDGTASGTDGADLDILGSLQSIGSDSSPVTITATEAGKNFGELHFSSGDPSLLQYTDIHRGGRSPGVGHTATGPTIRANHSTIVFDHANITDTAGKSMHSESGSNLIFRRCLLSRSAMGPEISGTALLLEESWLTDMHGRDDADGIYIHSQQNGQLCKLRGGVAALVDDDGIDLLGPTITIEDFFVRDTRDKGISLYNGDTTIRRCLIVETNIAPEDPTVSAVACKANDGGSATVHIDRSTIVATRMEGRIDFGIQSNNKYNVKSGRIYWNVFNSIIDATDPIQADAPYLDGDFHIEYSDIFDEAWPGAGNLHADPLFVDRAGHKYRLSASSPCVNAADPAQTDPDGTRLDMGYPFMD